MSDDLKAPERISLLPDDGWSWMAGKSPHEENAIEYIRADLYDNTTLKAAVEMMADEHGWVRREKLDKAVEALQNISRNANHILSRFARKTLAELEGEPLGAEFEAVWDANKGELYQE